MSWSFLAVILATPLFLGGTLAIGQEAVLHNFHNNGLGGASPRGGLIVDAAGNLYGTTTTGGSNNVGTVFELLPNGTGGWKEKVLHNFRNDGRDGNTPSASLIFDAAGDLYGATPYGGAYQDGVVYELLPQTGGGWKEKILHTFGGNANRMGQGPFGNLVFDAAGNLYCTTEAGGAYGGGTVFELIPSADGTWTEKVLHVFNTLEGDAYFPISGLTFDARGNLYSTTWVGGLHGQGTVFELSPNANGSWTEKVLHSFNHNGSDGYQPFAGLILDAAGSLYGTTEGGGAHDGGTVFKLTQRTDGTWKETVLHSFQNNGSDGYRLFSGLTLDAAGNVYGTTSLGGSSNGGTVFELKPQASGAWTEVLLHNFNDNGKDGSSPYPGGPLIFDRAGNLYGTTVAGGTDGAGTVFEVTP
jgi:uncharacterized repeat protein (TIGR03803 family)